MQCKIVLGMVSNLEDLVRIVGLCDLKLTKRVFLTRGLGRESDAVRLVDRDIQAYSTLQIPVPNLSGRGFVIHIERCKGEKKFRGQQRNDWV